MMQGPGIAGSCDGRAGTDLKSGKSGETGMAGQEQPLELEQFVSVLVTQLAKQIERHADEFLRSVAGISVHEWRLLVHIYRFRNRRMADVAVVLNYPDGPFHELAEGLCAKHFSRLAPGEDGEYLEPTSVGEGIYLTILPHMERRQRRLLEGLQPAEAEQLRALLRKLIGHMDGLLAEQRSGRR